MERLHKRGQQQPEIVASVKKLRFKLTGLQGGSSSTLRNFYCAHLVPLPSVVRRKDELVTRFESWGRITRRNKMKLLYATIFSLALLFTNGYARDLPELAPNLEVTGLVVGDKVKNATIINDRIAYRGDVFEVVDGKLGVKVVISKGVKIGPNTLTIGSITSKGVTVYYAERETSFVETKFIPIKKRK